MRPRRIALCVEVWSDPQNHYAWTFTRKRLLQDQQRPGVEDQLFVVHVNKPRDPIQWQTGGPAVPDVTTALQDLSHTVVELEGDPVAELVKFANEKDVHILILGSKGRSRVKRTVSKGTAVRVVQQAPCACVVVGPKLSSGEHFRIQAARKSEGVGQITQFRRRVAIVLNAGPFDPNMVQYAARNVLLAGDRVVLVRCMSKEVLGLISSKQQPEQERDNVREIGRNKLRGAEGIAMAVEVLKGGLKMICNFVESKGIDLVVMAREQRLLVRRSLSGIGAGPPALRALYHRCPCPCMVVPMECLQYDWSSSSRSSAVSSGRDPLSSSSQSRINVLGRQVSTPITARLRTLSLRHQSWKGSTGTKSGPLLQRAAQDVQNQQSSTIDNAQIGQRPRVMAAAAATDSTDSVMEVIRNEEIELEAIEELDLDQAATVGEAGGSFPCAGVASPFDNRKEERDLGRRETEDAKEDLREAKSEPPVLSRLKCSEGAEVSRTLTVGSPQPRRPTPIRRMDSSRSEGSLDFNISPRAAGEVVHQLKQQLAEKDQEILMLKAHISKLTVSSPRKA